MQFIETDYQWADIFTKPLCVERFNFIKKEREFELYLRMMFASE
jgi:hypothetical protein